MFSSTQLRETRILRILCESSSICFGPGAESGVTSELTLAEVLPKASDVQRRGYLGMIVWSQIFELRPVSRDILIETAEYREHAGMPKLPDAIHVVTAIRAGCRTVLSADLRLKLPEGYSVLSPAAENLNRLIRELS